MKEFLVRPGVWRRSTRRPGAGAGLLVLLVGLALGVPQAARAQVNFNVYGDVGYAVGHQNDWSHAFNAPRVELLPSGAAGRFSFLAEIIFEVGPDNAFAVDVERLEAAWLFGDWLKLKAGRFHTAIGYYNDAFHHGNYFLLPVDRPLWVNFEDSGGLIPAHSIGVQAEGRLPLGTFGHFKYDLELGNGRGTTLNALNNKFDNNNFKSMNVRLRVEPKAVQGLIIGVNAYIDRIAANADPALRVSIPELDEKIFGAHVAFQEIQLKFIAEGAVFLHSPTAGGTNFTTWAGNVELGWSFDDLTPYVGLDRVSFSNPIDPYFFNAAGGAAGSYTRIIGGLKWTVSDNLALKLQAGHQFFDGGGNGLDLINAQAAFAY